jgi:hypothetical protein
MIASRPFISGICKSISVTVWTMGTELLDRLAAVRGLGDQSHIRLGADENGYALPYEDMVVNRQNSNLS